MVSPGPAAHPASASRLYGFPFVPSPEPFVLASTYIVFSPPGCSTPGDGGGVLSTDRDGVSVFATDGDGESVFATDGDGESVFAADGDGESVFAADGDGVSVFSADGDGESVFVIEGEGDSVFPTDAETDRSISFPPVAVLFGKSCSTITAHDASRHSATSKNKYFMSNAIPGYSKIGT